MKASSAQEAIAQIKSRDNVFIHSVAGAPRHLIHALVERADSLNNVNLYHLHTEGDAPYADEKYENSFNVYSLFIGANVRHCINAGRGSYIPIFLSEAPSLFRNNIIPLDVALITVSPPDSHGFCSLGTSVDTTLAAMECAKIVIAQVNKNMPRTHGDGIVHKHKIDYFVEYDEPLVEVAPKPLSDTDKIIGKYIADHIEDGATLQMGIGAIPNAVLAALGNHKDLGIHTEMFSDGVIPLVKSGVITGKHKKIIPNKITATFAMGSKELYDFVDDNPEIMMLDCSFVNDTHIIRQNPKVTAINSAIEIDLTGQICADSIGKNMYSGVGGQMDYIRGASLSEGGKPIIALPSITKKGISRIVPFLKEGAGVVTTRAHVQYVVTEWGVANLYGKSLKERAKALIEIAHPDQRESLSASAYEIFNHHKI